MMTTRSTFLVYLLALVASISATGIPNIPQCNSCFESLPKGCAEKISNSGTNSTAAQSAYQDCLCTKQYIDNFMNCATCSAKSMNSDQLPTEKDKNDAVTICTSNGFPIQGSSPAPSTNSTGSTSGLNGTPTPSSSNRPGATSGPQPNQTNNASKHVLAGILMVSSVALMGLGFVSEM